MSEKLIDHEYDGIWYGRDTGNCLHGYCPPDGNPGCGQPRSRHRQAEKAQDFGERPRECQLDDLFGCIETHGFPTDREAWAKIVEPALAACAGAADPQPGELARLRAIASEVPADEQLRPGLVAAAFETAKRCGSATVPHVGCVVSQLAQALLVLKALDPWLYSDGAVLAARHTWTAMPNFIAAFEALRKDGLL